MLRRRWQYRFSLVISALLGLLLIPGTPASANPIDVGYAPAASGSGNFSMVVVTGKALGDMGFSQWQLGQTSNWNGVSDCPSHAAPAVSLVNNGSYAFVLRKSPGGTLVLTQGDPRILNAVWSQCQSMNVTTNLAPAAASWGNRTAAAVVATDGTIDYDWWDLGGGGHGFRQIPGGFHTDATPAVALVDNGNYLFVLAKAPGANGMVYLNQGSPGGTWVGWQSMHITTNVGPGAASQGNRTVALITATDGTIAYEWWDLGGGGNGFRPVPGGFHTDAAPAASLVNNGTYLFVDAKTPGPTGDVDMNQGTLGGAWVGWQILTPHG